MKKIINIFLTFSVVSSCSSNSDSVVDNNSDTELSCIEKIAKYSDIVSAQAINYNNVDGSTESCMAYRNAIEDYIVKTAGCPNNASILASFQFALENLDCN